MSAGQDVITQGETGDYFYVVDKGNLEILVNGDHVGKYTNGSSFGELAYVGCPARRHYQGDYGVCGEWTVTHSVLQWRPRLRCVARGKKEGFTVSLPLPSLIAGFAAPVDI